MKAQTGPSQETAGGVCAPQSHVITPIKYFYSHSAFVRGVPLLPHFCVFCLPAICVPATTFASAKILLI